MRQIVLDTETTGLDVNAGHRIIEIGAVELVDRRISGRQFHEYINPDRDIEDGALEVHGITSEFLADKPRFNEIVAEFLEFVDGAELVIHNAEFDMGFINAELGLLETLPAQGLGDAVVDTLEVARDLHPGQRNNLDALCKRYEIDNSNRTLHGALLDAEILADVYLAMTGGQTDLGLSFDSLVEDDHSAGPVGAEDHGPLVVLRAEPEELESHEARIQAIRKNAGKCLWTELDDGV